MIAMVIIERVRAAATAEHRTKEMAVNAALRTACLDVARLSRDKLATDSAHPDAPMFLLDELLQEGRRLYHSDDLSEDAEAVAEAASNALLTLERRLLLMKPGTWDGVLCKLRLLDDNVCRSSLDIPDWAITALHADVRRLAGRDKL